MFADSLSAEFPTSRTRSTSSGRRFNQLLLESFIYQSSAV
jgi:hypothetical protein